MGTRLELSHDELPTPDEAAEVLRRLRARSGLNLATFARCLQLDPFYVWQYERGDVRPGIGLRRAIVMAFSLLDLSKGENHAPSSQISPPPSPVHRS